MNARFQIRIQRYGWDKAADHYEDGWKESLAPAQTKLNELAAAKPGDHVLDLACGTGLVALPLATAVGPSGRVLATDLSDRMVEHTHSLANKHGFLNVETLRADAEDLSMIDDATFDLVTCALGLMYCPDPLTAMQEAFRVLKPGGRAVFAVWGARKSCGWAEIFPIVDARVQSPVCPMFFRLGTGNALAMEMAEAGFSEIAEHRLNSHLPYDNDKAAADAAFVGGPVALAYNRFNEATRAAAREEYLQSIAPYKHGLGYKIPGEFVVCRGVKSDN